MNQQDLQESIKAWEQRAQDVLEMNLELLPEFLSANREHTARWEQMQRDRVDFALSIAKQMGEHFSSRQLVYEGAYTRLCYFDSRQGYHRVAVTYNLRLYGDKYHPCATLFDLDQRNARDTINRALAIRGIQARIGWSKAKNEPTITKGYRLQKDEWSSGWSIYAE